MVQRGGTLSAVLKKTDTHKIICFKCFVPVVGFSFGDSFVNLNTKIPQCANLSEHFFTFTWLVGAGIGGDGFTYRVEHVLDKCHQRHKFNKSAF